MVDTVRREGVRDLIPNPFERRKAQRLADLLEESDGGPRQNGRTDRDHEVTELAHVGQALQQASPSIGSAATPDPEFHAALRRRLMATAAAEGIGTAAKKSVAPIIPRQRTRRRFAFAALVVGMVLGLSGVATASGDAVPGDALYPLKRTTERAQLALAGSDVNRGQLYLEFARTRLSEAEGLTSDPVALTTALSDMDSDTIEGVRSLTTAAVEREDVVVLDAIDVFVSEQRPAVVTLMDSVSGEAGIRAAEALSLLDEVSQRSNELRNMLPCVTEDSNTDRLGPVASVCSAMPESDGDVGAPDGAVTSEWDDETGQGEQNPSEGENGDTESPSPEETPSPSSSDDNEDDEDEDDEDDEDDGGFLSELGDLLSGLLGGWVSR